MAVQRYKIPLSLARFPLVSSWGRRAVVIGAADGNKQLGVRFQGDDDNVDAGFPQILYGENFVPVADGVKSVSYSRIIAPTVNTDFDQIFPLRDDQENTVLYSPAQGKNYAYDKNAGAWTTDPMAAKWTAEGLRISNSSKNTLATAAVTRAYVDGKTFVCYSKIALTTDAGGVGITDDGSVYLWDPVAKTLGRTDLGNPAAIIKNLDIPLGDIGGIAESNGYLLFWSGLEVHWAPFNGTAFDYAPYANGEVTGAGSQIPEAIQGPITAIVPMSGGFIIYTTKNAIAAFYNSNNFASPWIFKPISNAGGVESFEQVAVEGNQGSMFAYTTGGMQRMTLNNAESPFPDVTDFLGGRLIERFNTGDLTFDEGYTSAEFFVKITYCGQRFLVISYGTYPGVYSFALVYDASLQRWGKLRIVHRDCFSYSYGSAAVNLTYSMLGDIPYSDLGTMTYGTATIAAGALTYPRQSVAFLLKTGEVVLAAMDHRDPADTSEAFVVVGKNQLSRARLSTLHELEVEGLKAGGQVAVWRSVDGRNLEAAENGYLREQDDDYAEYGFDLPTGKNFTFFVKGNFHLTSLIAHASNDGSI